MILGLGLGLGKVSGVKASLPLAQYVPAIFLQYHQILLVFLHIMRKPNEDAATSYNHLLCSQLSSNEA